jgi:hypothetical protein
VAGPGSIVTTPAITTNDGSVNLVANIGMLNGLAFYCAVNGTATWHLETLAGWFGGALAITTDPGGVHVVVIGAFGGVADEATSNGTGTWQLTSVTGGLTRPDPAVTANDGIENVAGIGGDGNLYFREAQADGAFARELVDTSANL